MDQDTTQTNRGDGPDRFRLAVESLPGMLRDLQRSQEHNQATRLEIPLVAGVYLFTEAGCPMYVGQTRKLRNRYDYHTHPRGGHNQASFAFLLAKEVAVGNGLDTNRKRDDLQADPDFAAIFTAAKARVAAMHFRFLCCEDPIQRTLFEVYAALHLGTERYNSFETH